MLTVVIGSNNPVKIKVVESAFSALWPEETFTFKAVEASSGVADQPEGDEETKVGASNRARAAETALPSGDYFVGLEGGVELVDEQYWSFAWMCVRHRSGAVGLAKTCTYVLPPALNKQLAAGVELGVAADQLFRASNSKQGIGTSGLLTNGLVARHDYYLQAMILALVPFWRQDLY